jgi:DNA-directed RNA polymerase specialized sigma24 family protein
MAESNRLPTTHWSLIQVAGRKSSATARQVLETLCRIYWPPVYAYFRRRGINAVEAQDLTQAFFAELLGKDYLLQAKPERGRFRSFLLTACQHFLAKERAKARARKHGGGQAPLALDFAAAEKRLSLEPAAGTTPEQEYERQWAMTLLACPECGGRMKVVAFIQPPQREGIEKILLHCGLWHPWRVPPQRGGRRASPAEDDALHGPADFSDGHTRSDTASSHDPGELTYVDIDTFLATL